MKKIIMGAFIALILFVVILLALMPAKVATSWIADAVPGVNFSNTEGTVWSMEADAVQYRQFRLNDISLSTNPLALLVGTLSSDLKISDPNASIDSELSLSAGNYEASNTQFDLDTNYIASFMRLPINGLRGRVIGQIERFHFAQNSLMALQGEGEWRNAVIEYPNNDLELGNIRFSLSKVPDTNSAKLKIIDNQGLLDLKGFIDVWLDKRFNMKLHTTASLPANMKNWLSSWGREENGRIYLEWQGQLP